MSNTDNSPTNQACSDYPDLPVCLDRNKKPGAVSDASILAEHANEIRALVKRSRGDIIEIGTAALGALSADNAELASLLAGRGTALPPANKRLEETIRKIGTGPALQALCNVFGYCESASLAFARATLPFSKKRRLIQCV
jgi:hypothetical protein